MIQYILSLSLIDQCLLGALVIVFAYQIFYYLYFLRLPKSAGMAEKSVGMADQSSGRRSVSVIVAAKNEADNLRPYLQTLLEQDYPEYEVIVINDGSEDLTRAVLEEYEHKYSRLHTTFVPNEARVLSSKKLAITLGIKAAKYDYLLLTDADCRPESKHWISSMMSGFDQSDEIEVVLGYGGYFEEELPVNRIIQYETTFNALQYLGMAYRRIPYMGVGRNLAYTKSLFMRRNGFAGLIGERSGDDDLFINQVANGRNTAVVCTRESITWSVPKRTFAEWLHQRSRHLSVSPLYRPVTKFRLAIEPLSRGVWYVLMVLSVVFGTWKVWGVAALLFVLRFMVQWRVLNYGSKRLGGSGFGLSIIFYDIYLPLLSAWMLLKPVKKNQYW